MILNTAPTNEAIVSNVGEIGEFRIRNSAKAFNILSSGLYANKIRAIIRELSCNAVDSHIAAGKQDTPFDVHLPNQLEPWFAIRDYGTGLSHDEVTNIYTTYFESTKTDSNDYIGALGLGSKSPFSYTDNFTVTAIKNGKKGIYTAFINEHGVPSIALMTTEDTAEPAGVEVRFSVNSYYDFSKFVDEARNVYTYFSLRPVISGVNKFEFRNIAYEIKNIIPGVHQTNNNSSVAIMGNIAYPIQIPETDKSLGDLRNMLNCGLELHFAIGELDFQASREGLSYIPHTVDSIRKKLESLNLELYTHLVTEADAIDNLWTRAIFLAHRRQNQLWAAAVVKYATDTKLPTFSNSHYNSTATLELSVEDLANKYNIQIRGFQKTRNTMTMPSIKTTTVFGPAQPDGIRKTIANWRFVVNNTDHFIVNNLKRGAKERVKYHYRESEIKVDSRNVYILNAVDREQPMNVKAFFKALHNPPAQQRLLVSALLEKPRNTGGNWGKASILRLEERDRGRYNKTMVWANAGTAVDYDSTKTYYYIEMEGWNPVGVPMSDIKDFYELVRKAGVFFGHIYGVRRKDIPAIRTQKNWIELGSYIRNSLQSTDMTDVMGLVKSAIDFKNVFKYINKKLNQQSPYYKLYAEFKDIQTVDSDKRYYLEKLFNLYGIQVANVKPDDVIKQYKSKIEELDNRYPMLSQLSNYSVKIDVVVDYINMVDQVKGI